MADQGHAVGPAPYPPDTRAKGWRFELDYETIQQSDTWALADEIPMAQPALLMMWLMAWSQTPCGSLPNDEAVIRAKCKIPAKDWPKLRPLLMRGWWLADDGRLYHPTITKRVQEMLDRKDGERNRKAEYRAKKEAERKLVDANLAANSVPECPDLSHGTDLGLTPDSHGKDDTGTGTGTGLCTGKLNAHRDSACDQVDGPAKVMPTKAGVVCKLMRQQGLPDCSPSHPTLLELLSAGAQAEEFSDAAKKAAASAKGFAYALGIVASARRQAKAVAAGLHQGPMPASGPAQRRAPAPENFTEKTYVGGLL